MAADSAYWKTVIFSTLLTTLAGPIGVAELHCGCVVRGDSGFLLAGCSGSGKSTLTLALAQAGCAFLSDDRTWVSWRDGTLQAWGLPTLLKLRPDAITLFPEIQHCEPAARQDGQKVLQIDVERHLGLQRALCCEPRAVVFLERHKGSKNSLTRMPADEASARLRQDLLPETREVAERQRETIDKVVAKGSWLLRHGGTPQEASAALIRMLDARIRSQIAVNCFPTRILPPRETAAPPDPFRLLTPTPHSIQLQVMGRSIRLETNSRTVLNDTQRLFTPYGSFGENVEHHQSPAGAPAFRWRIVADSDIPAQLPWPRIAAFSDESMRYTSIGHQNFVAVDLESHTAVGFLAEGLAGSEPGFCSLFLDTLLCMTAGSLGLTPVFSSCVAFEGRGLLVFGPPDSGKTTSSYLAGEMGVEFHADQATFLDLEGGRLRAWAGFLPAAFRPETLQFLPDLSGLTRPLRYLNLTLLELDLAAVRLGCSDRVFPVGWVFLKRTASSAAHLTSVDPSERVGLLENFFLFKEHRRFDSQRRAILAALASLPGHYLAYGDDPAEAAVFFRGLLSAEGTVETKA
jgi:hypothetical protein